MMPILLMFSVYLLLRGHDLPGGGFIGGLVAGAAFLLQGVAAGPRTVRQLIPFDVGLLLPAGLSISLLAGVPALLLGGHYLTGLWVALPVLGRIKVGTPILFDLGVYLVVTGVAVQIITLVAEEERWRW